MMDVNAEKLKLLQARVGSARQSMFEIGRRFLAVREEGDEAYYKNFYENIIQLYLKDKPYFTRKDLERIIEESIRMADATIKSKGGLN